MSKFSKNLSSRDSPSPGNEKASQKPVIPRGNDDFGNLPNQVASNDNVTGGVDQKNRRDTKSAGNSRHVSFKNEDEPPAKTRAQVVS